MDPIIKGVGQLLAYLFDLVPNYGIAIILLTVTVRLAMVPLAVKQAHMMQKARPHQEKMRKLQPELKKIREKYRDDRQKQYEETQKLMKEHEVNQFAGLGGCLPMLVQLPIFYAMYKVLGSCSTKIGRGKICPPEQTGILYLPAGSALRTAIAGGSGAATFLGMNLGLHPSAAYSTLGLAGAWPYYLLVGLMGLTMWYQQKQTMRLQPPADPQQAAMMKPLQYFWILFVWFSLNFPVGLTLYWVTSNTWTIGQQYILLKRYGPDAPPRAPKVKGGDPAAPDGATGPDKAAGKAASKAPTAAPNGQPGRPKGSGAKKKRSGKR